MPRDKSLLTKSFHEAQLAALASILSVEVAALPPVFLLPRPKALKIGISADLIARYPQADPEQISAWLARWTGTTQYLQRVKNGLNRHDLDGNDHELIAEPQRGHAAGRLAKRFERAKAHVEGAPA